MRRRTGTNLSDHRIHLCVVDARLLSHGTHFAVIGLTLGLLDLESYWMGVQMGCP